MFFWLAFILLDGIRHFFAISCCSIDRVLITLTVLISSAFSIEYVCLHTLVLLSITTLPLLLFLITDIYIHISTHYYLVMRSLLSWVPIILFYI